MNHKTKRRWFALSSLIITFLLVKLFQDNLVLAIKSDRPLEAGVQSVRYSLAKWDYYYTNLLSEKETKALVHDSPRRLSNIQTTDQKRNTYGYQNHEEKLIIPPVLDTPERFGEKHMSKDYIKGNISARFADKAGIIHESGTVVVPFIYDRLELNRNNDYIIATKRGRQGVIDLKGNTIVPFDYDKLTFISASEIASLSGQEYLNATQKNRQKVIDLDNNTVVPFAVDHIIEQTPNITLAEVENVIGFVDRQQFAPLTVDENGNYFTNGVAIVHSLNYYSKNYEIGHQRYCVVNRQGQIIIPDRSDSDSDRRITNNLCRKLAEAKQLPIYTKNSTNEPELGKLRPIKINDKYGYINSQSELAIAPQFDSVEGIKGGFNLVINKSKSLTGIITPAGRYIPLPTKNNGEYQINEATLVTHMGDWYEHHCIIDRAGNFLLSAAASNASKLEQKMMEKIDNICRNLVGIKVNNELITEPHYPPSPPGEPTKTPYGHHFRENLLSVKINGKYGYVNRRGELAFHQLFDYAGHFSEKLGGKRLAIVGKVNDLSTKYPDNTKFYYLNQNGQIIAGNLINTNFLEAKYIAPDLIKTKIKVESGGEYIDLYGLMKPDGEIIVEHHFEFIGNLSGDYIKVRGVRDDDFTWIDRTGESVEKLD